MNLRIDDQIVVEGRVLVVLGFDPFGVPAGRIHLEDGATGEPVTELIARLQQPSLRFGRHPRKTRAATGRRP